jgi:hypothetical protein
LRVEGRTIAEPCLEFVVLGAAKLINDHGDKQFPLNFRFI